VYSEKALFAPPGVIIKYTHAGKNVKRKRLFLWGHPTGIANDRRQQGVFQLTISLNQLRKLMRDVSLTKGTAQVLSEAKPSRRI
jgi:hypothetical protein